MRKLTYKEIMKLRNSKKYRDWRNGVLIKNDFRCKCGMFGDCLHAHHKISFQNILKKNNIQTVDEAISCKELWDVDNGECLCSCCHIDLHIKLNQKKT